MHARIYKHPYIGWEAIDEANNFNATAIIIIYPFYTAEINDVSLFLDFMGP